MTNKLEPYGNYLKNDTSSEQPVFIERRGIGEIIFDACGKFADRICNIDADQQVSETFASIKLRSIRAAIALSKKGLTKSDNVIVCSPNNLDIMIGITSCLFLGVKVAALDPTLSVKELAHLTEIVQPKLLIINEVSLPLIERSLQALNLKVDVIVIGKSTKYETFDSLVLEKPEEKSFKPIVIEDIRKETAIIIFSSGTTGLSKGICLSHFGLLYSYTQFMKKGFKTDVFYHSSSMYWISGWGMMLMSFLEGSQRILSSDSSVENIFRLIQRYKITNTFLSSTYAHNIIAQKDTLIRYDLSSLDTFILAGSGLSVDTILQVQGIIGKGKVCLGYGMTETSGFVSLYDSRERHLLEEYPSSSGTLCSGCTLKVVDMVTRKHLGPNQKGELCLKTEAFMLGYLGLNSSERYDEEGFLMTGDIGYFTKEGCLYIVDRIKDMFKYQGWHVLPANIEKEISKHSAVKETVAFGVPDEINGELPAALVILNEGAVITEEELTDFVNKNVSEREQLRGGLKFIDKIPKTPSGKVLRNRARDLFLGR